MRNLRDLATAFRKTILIELGLFGAATTPVFGCAPKPSDDGGLDGTEDGGSGEGDDSVGGTSGDGGSASGPSTSPTGTSASGSAGVDSSTTNGEDGGSGDSRTTNHDGGGTEDSGTMSGESRGSEGSVTTRGEGEGSSDSATSGSTSETTDGDETGTTCEPPDPHECGAPPPDHMQETICFSTADVPCEACDEECMRGHAWAHWSTDFCSPEHIEVQCGPFSCPASEQPTCCFVAARTLVEVCEGRPFRVGETHRVAGIEVRADWCAPLESPSDALDPKTRRALAHAWARDAAAEHASVAAFARFVLQLLAVGAPAELVADAQRALADEVRHARLCFTLASRYAGESIGPAPLPMQGALDVQCDLAVLATSTFLEGCLGETLAAVFARVAAQRATDPMVRDVLTTIADDESRHALLAWRCVKWAMLVGGERVRTALEAIVDAVPTVVMQPAIGDDAELDSSVASDHGRLDRATQEQLARSVVDDVVLPCVRLLLDNPVRHSDDALASQLV